jgi:hypothetical protein
MNPDEILKKALSLAQAATEPRASPTPADAVQLSELILALDRYLSGGGKLPARWSSPAVLDSDRGS